MVLATVGKDGAPSARVVLLRGVGEGCLVFFTSYTSRKGERVGGQPQSRRGVPLAQAEPPGQGGGQCRARVGGGVGRIFCEAAPAKAG